MPSGNRENPGSEISDAIAVNNWEQLMAEGRLRIFQLPKLHCPTCNADISLSGAKHLEPWSFCHGWLVLTPQEGSLFCIVDFYTTRPDIAALEVPQGATV